MVISQLQIPASEQITSPQLQWGLIHRQDLTPRLHPNKMK